MCPVSGHVNTRESSNRGSRIQRRVRGLEGMRCEERLKKFGLFSLQKENVSGDLEKPKWVFPYLGAGYMENGSNLLKVLSERPQSVHGHKLQQEKFW